MRFSLIIILKSISILLFLKKGIKMNEVLKGNFKTKNKVIVETKEENSLESRFEKKAMERLGGSIAYVSKKKVKWDLDDGS